MSWTTSTEPPEGHHRAPAEPPAVCSLQLGNRTAKDAVNTGLRYTLHHLDQRMPGSCLWTSARPSTLILDFLHQKLTQLTVPTSVDHWLWRWRSTLGPLKQILALLCNLSSVCLSIICLPPALYVFLLLYALLFSITYSCCRTIYIITPCTATVEHLQFQCICTVTIKGVSIRFKVDFTVGSIFRVCILRRPCFKVS